MSLHEDIQRHEYLGLRHRPDGEDRPPVPIGTINVPVPTSIAGVYFLLLRGEVQYIGSTTNIYTRLEKHVKDGRKLFDECKLLPMEVEKRDWDEPYENMIRTEYDLIREFRPPYNNEWKRIRK